MIPKYSTETVHFVARREHTDDAAWRIACGAGTIDALKAARYSHRVTCILLREAHLGLPRGIARRLTGRR